MEITTKQLFESVTFSNGMTSTSRFVLAPMVSNAASPQGYVTKEELQYMTRRNDSASLLVTGSASVAPFGNAFGYGLGIEDESYLPGLTELASAMKEKGNLAIIQLYHPGRGAKVSYQEQGVAYGPSTKQFSFLDYPTTGMTMEQVEEMIASFARAAVLAYRAGFDGVEIHGANHFLLQQFFSALSNERTDRFGGSLEKRMQFTLDVFQAVKEALRPIQERPFMMGYRVSPEEIHGDAVGYTLEDSLQLIEAVLEMGIDYISCSLFGPNGYKKEAQAGKFKGQIIAKVLHRELNQRVPLIIVGDITQPEKAVDALCYGDLVALASAALVEPDFKQRMENGDMGPFDYQEVAKREDLFLSKNFGDSINLIARNQAIPEQALVQLKQRLDRQMKEEDR